MKCRSFSYRYIDIFRIPFCLTSLNVSCTHSRPTKSHNFGFLINAKCMFIFFLNLSFTVLSILCFLSNLIKHAQMSIIRSLSSDFPCVSCYLFINGQHFLCKSSHISYGTPFCFIFIFFLFLLFACL